MKAKFYCIALLILGTLATNVISAQNTIDKQGRKQGHWIKTDKDGSKIYEGNFKNDLEVDTFLYYYPGGQLRIRNIYTTPGKICFHETYDENGKLLAKGTYNQKNRDGQWLIYNESGQLIKIATYRMGVKEGPQVIFTPQGDTAEVSNWVDNHRDGRWWKRIGKQSYITGTFKKGVLDGKLYEYDEQGLKASEGTYTNGTKNGKFDYFENGILTVSEKWVKGVMLERNILLTSDTKKYVNTNSIAYFAPKGKEHAMVFFMDGTTLNCQESVERIFDRAGMEQFILVDKKNRIVSNKSCIIGLTKDGEGRDILDLDPKPSFMVFPDEDCQKMVKSLQRIDELDKD